jgi:hypothetical protein
MKKKLGIIFLVACLAALFLFFHQHIVISSFEEFSLKERGLVSGETNFTLPDSGAFLLKIWCRGYPESVEFNNTQLIHSFFRARPKLNEFYYFLDKAVTREGENSLRVRAPYNYSILIKNHFTITDFGVIFLKSKGFNRKAPPDWPAPVFLAVFLCYNLIFLKLLDVLMPGSAKHFLPWIYLLTFAPLVALFGLSSLVSKFSPISIYFFEFDFFGIIAAESLLSLIFVLLVYLAWYFSEKTKDRTMLNDLKNNSSKALQWWMRQHLIHRFVFLFIFFLANSLLWLMTRRNFLAEMFAILAYIFLFTAVILKWKELHGPRNA